MNINNWIPILSNSVQVRECTIYDKDLDLNIPLNKVADMIVKEMDGKTTCGDIYEKTKNLFSIDNEIFYVDLKAFIFMINSKGIINLRYKNYYPIIENVINFFAQYKPKLRFRYEVDKDAGFLSLFFIIFHIVMKQVFIFWFIPAVCYIVLFFMSKSNQFMLMFGYLTMIYSGLVSSFALHEVLHIKMYRNKCKSTDKGCVIVNLFSIKFIRPELKSDLKTSLLVTLMGPLMTGIIGCIYFGIMNFNNINQVWLIPFSFSLMYFICYFYCLFREMEDQLLLDCFILEVKKCEKYFKYIGCVGKIVFHYLSNDCFRLYDDQSISRKIW